MSKRNLVNIHINEKAESKSYKPVNTRGSEGNFPLREDRSRHASYLQRQFDIAWKLANKLKVQKNAVSANTNDGVYLQIKGKEGHDLLTKSLENVAQHVRLYNVQEDENGITSSTVFIPNDKKNFFLKKINKYKETENKEKVVGTIESINLALVEALWIGNKSSIPVEVPTWCEMWLIAEVKEDSNAVVDEFFSICKKNRIPYKEQRIIFPEKIVVGVKANKKQLSNLQIESSRITEIRKMVTPTSFFVELSQPEQREWVKDLERRLDVAKMSNTSVC